MGRSLTGGAIPQLGVAARNNRHVFVGASLAAALLILATIIAHTHTSAPGPAIKPFLPICVTIWCFAEVLTAFLLLSQFYVGGKISFAIIAGGYMITGLTTIPYLAWFPGVFHTAALPLAEVQISAWLWTIWHIAFPLSIAAAHAVDRSLDTKSVPRKHIRASLIATIVAGFGFTLIVTAAVYFFRAHLPVVVDGRGHFSSFYQGHLVPVVAAINALSLAYVLLRGRPLSPLQVWLSVALLTMTLDLITNIWAPGRYSAVWYVGKFEALLTSVVVLVMLLLEVATLYRRLYDVASVDTLTGLPNRRSFNDSLARTLDDRDPHSSGVALIVVDIDYFKGYNDHYGHAAGDTALASVADALHDSLVRSNDFVARIGGEEFVILLPDVIGDEVARIAERVRRRVEGLGIMHAGAPAGLLTISVGAAFCPRVDRVSPAALFEFADRALYQAKSTGRNTVVVRHHANSSDGTNRMTAVAG